MDDLEMRKQIAEAEGLPVTGVVIIQGQPYVNSVGLHWKLNNYLKEKGFEIKRFYTQGMSETAEKNGEDIRDDDALEVFWCHLVLFDKQQFLEALKKLAEESAQGAIDIKELAEAFTYYYSASGWATAKTCEGIAYEYVCVERDPETGRCKRKERGRVLRENVAMMAERRAINRTLRLAVGIGLTSLEELPAGTVEHAEPRITDKQKALIRRIMKSRVFTDEEREKTEEAIKNMGVREASRLIDKLREEEARRKKEEKEQEGG